MRAGGQYHYSLVTCTHQKKTLPALHLSEPREPVHYGCTQEHHRLAQHAERQTHVNGTGPETQITTENVCAVNSACAVSP